MLSLIRIYSIIAFIINIYSVSSQLDGWTCYNYTAVVAYSSAVANYAADPWKCFRAYCANLTRDQAQQACEADGGTLAEIYTSADDSAIIEAIAESISCAADGVWFAGRLNEGCYGLSCFSYPNKCQINCSYSAWADNQPSTDFPDGTDLCTVVDSTGNYSVQACDSLNAYVCQITESISSACDPDFGCNCVFQIAAGLPANCTVEYAVVGENLTLVDVVFANFTQQVCNFRNALLNDSVFRDTICSNYSFIDGSITESTVSDSILKNSIVFEHCYRNVTLDCVTRDEDNGLGFRMSDVVIRDSEFVRSTALAFDWHEVLIESSRFADNLLTGHSYLSSQFAEFEFDFVASINRSVIDSAFLAATVFAHNEFAIVKSGVSEVNTTCDENNCQYWSVIGSTFSNFTLQGSTLNGLTVLSSLFFDSIMDDIAIDSTLFSRFNSTAIDFSNLTIDDSQLYLLYSNNFFIRDTSIESIQLNESSIVNFNITDNSRLANVYFDVFTVVNVCFNSVQILNVTLPDLCLIDLCLANLVLTQCFQGLVDTLLGLPPITRVVTETVSVLFVALCSQFFG